MWPLGSAGRLHSVVMENGSMFVTVTLIGGPEGTEKVMCKGLVLVVSGIYIIIMLLYCITSFSGLLSCSICYSIAQLFSMVYVPHCGGYVYTMVTP